MCDNTTVNRSEKQAERRNLNDRTGKINAMFLVYVDNALLYNYNYNDDFNSATYSVRWQESPSRKQTYIKHKIKNSKLTLTEATVLMLVCEIWQTTAITGSNFRIFTVAYICALLCLVSYTTAKLGPHAAVTWYYRYWLRYWWVSVACVRKCIISSCIVHITHSTSEQSNTVFITNCRYLLTCRYLSLSAGIVVRNCTPFPKFEFAQGQFSS